MQVNNFTKTITLTKDDIIGEYWRGNIYDVKWYDVKHNIRCFIISYDCYKVVFNRGKKTSLMIYNK